MLKIRKEILDSFDDKYRKGSTINHIWNKVKLTFPELCVNIADEEGIKRTKEAMEDAKSINIIDNQDLLLFVGLAVLPKKIIEDPWFSSVIIRVLNQLDKPASERLEFLYRHVLKKDSNI